MSDYPNTQSGATLPANPYRGTESFRTGDKLFGRSNEVAEFASRLIARRVVLLHSPSGAGKTSLVQAGLIPELNKRGLHILPKIRLGNQLEPGRLLPGQGCNRYMASALLSLEAGEGIPSDQRLLFHEIATLSLQSDGLLRYLESHAPTAQKTRARRKYGKPPGAVRSLLFFDQFEEVLTLDPTDGPIKKDFFARLAPVLSDYRFVTIFAMREEFVAGMEPYLVYFPERLSARFRLELLGQEAAMQAIILPTKEKDVNVKFDKKAAARLVHDLSQVSVREAGQVITKDGQYVEPVQLQVVCSDLFERSAGDRKITLEDVQRFGSVENALGAYFDKKIKEVVGSDPQSLELEQVTRKLSAEIAARQANDSYFAKISATDPQSLRIRQIYYTDVAIGRAEDKLTDLIAQRDDFTKRMGWYPTDTTQGQRQRTRWRREAAKLEPQITGAEQELAGLKEFRLLFNSEAELTRSWNEKGGRLERTLRDWIEQELIISGSLRGQAAAGEELKFGIEPAIMEKLTEAFIIRKEQRRSLDWYELSHDSLVRPIIASNAAWRELHANEFETQAARWNKAPESERERALASGEALRTAVAWGDEHFANLSEAQKQFLSAARKRLGQLEVRRDDRIELGLNLEDTGWGVIFHSDAPPALREALRELLAHRQGQAGSRRSAYYREFFGPDGYRSGETTQRFLARFEAGSGPANPERMPYYLLIVGDPATIPFEFQYGLDAQYAVGRIFFESLEEYTRYARSVVTSEREHAKDPAADPFILPNRMITFAPQHSTEQASVETIEFLVKPLLARLAQKAPNWRLEDGFVAKAAKADLVKVLGGPQTPALLFTATYGLHVGIEYDDQSREQGALICQDWPGTAADVDLTSAMYFTGADLAPEANLLGTIVLMDGDFTGGTPQFDNYPTAKQKAAGEIASQPFLALLPQKLLSHPRGGTLAVIAHVDRAWTTSFLDATDAAQTTSDIGAYEKTIARLMQGATVGLAMEDFNRRYAYFSSLLSDELLAVTFASGRLNADRRRALEDMRNKTIDARNYILIGDPAARLPVQPDKDFQESPSGWRRPEIGAVSAPPSPPPEEAPVIEQVPTEAPPPTPVVQTAPQTAQVAAPVSFDSLAGALMGKKLSLKEFEAHEEQDSNQSY